MNLRHKEPLTSIAAILIHELDPGSSKKEEENGDPNSQYRLKYP